MAIRRYRGKTISKKGTPAVFRSNREKVLRKKLNLKNKGSAAKKGKSKAKAKKGSGK